MRSILKKIIIRFEKKIIIRFRRSYHFQKKTKTNKTRATTKTFKF